MHRAVIALLAGIALGACGTSSKLDGAARNDAAVPIATPPPAVPADLEARLARLERTVTKLTAVIDRMLGPVEADPNVVYSVAIDPRDPTEGPADAKVTIVHVFELMDPFSYLEDPIVAKLVEQHPKDVRVVWKYLVVHGPPAVPAGIVLCAAAKQGKWKPVKAALFAALFAVDKGQPRPLPEKGSLEQVKKLAGDAGVDLAKLAAAEADCRAWFQTTQDTVGPVGARTTPGFFINGRFLNGMQGFAALDQRVEDALATATKRIAEGVAPPDFYRLEIVDKGVKTVKGRFED